MENANGKNAKSQRSRLLTMNSIFKYIADELVINCDGGTETEVKQNWNRNYKSGIKNSADSITCA